MSKLSNKNKIPQEVDSVTLSTPSQHPITCTARTVQCVKNQGHNNFKILTLDIVDGVVTDIKYSDPYASFEIHDQFHYPSNKAIDSLNMHWEDGKCLSQ